MNYREFHRDSGHEFQDVIDDINWRLVSGYMDEGDLTQIGIYLKSIFDNAEITFEANLQED